METPKEQRVTPEKLDRWSSDWAGAKTQQIAQKAVWKNGIMESSQDIEVVKRLSDRAFAFSIDVDSEAVANQKQSGRCWMFACLNFLRWHIEKKLELTPGTFELSQAYFAFYNKLERAAWFLEHVIKTADKDLGDREVSYLMSAPMQDGGYWDWICGLVTKYGVIPHSAMSETHCTNNTAEINTVLSTLLRKDALKLREMVRENKSTDIMFDDMMSEVYRVLATCFGEPPKKIDFEYTDKNKKFHGDYGLTPKEFMDKYIPIDLNDYVALANYPGGGREFGKTYTIEDSDQIPNRPIHYLNVPLEDMKQLCIDQLSGKDGKDGEPIWFASDVLAASDKMLGVLSPQLYDMNAMFGIDLDMDKGDGLDTGDKGPDHAMVLAGVDIVNGKPTKWKIENSWGTTNGGQPTGHNGYFVCSDDWFDKYVYNTAIRKDLLTDAQRRALEETPEVLPYYTTV